MNDVDQRLPTALFTLRITVFLVMLMWTLDKILNPGHAGAVFENFYFIPGLGSVVLTAIGVAELVIILLFLAGIAKFWTYGAVLAFHAISTLSSWEMYLGFDNLLFFAAWPMLGACFALFWLRDQDTLLTVGSKG
jgi:hypothetical protein